VIVGGTGVWLGNGVRVGRGVGVRVTVGVREGVNVAEGVSVNVGVNVKEGVNVSVAVEVEVCEGVNVNVGVKVSVAVGVLVGNGVSVKVLVGVRLGSCTNVGMTIVASGARSSVQPVRITMNNARIAACLIIIVNSSDTEIDNLENKDLLDGVNHTDLCRNVPIRRASSYTDSTACHRRARRDRAPDAVARCRHTPANRNTSAAGRPVCSQCYAVRRPTACDT
jgi:hypothetical protein